MAIDYENLLKDSRVLKKLTQNQLAEYLEDEDKIYDDVDSGETVLSLGWDSTGPGGAGAIWITRWQDLYFLHSSDYESEGPFESMDEALATDLFSNGTYNPELASTAIPLEQLKDIALGLVGNDGELVTINRESYILKDGELVPWSRTRQQDRQDDESL